MLLRVDHVTNWYLTDLSWGILRSVTAIVFRNNLFRIIICLRLLWTHEKPTGRSFGHITASVSHPICTTDPTLPRAVLQLPLNYCDSVWSITLSRCRAHEWRLGLSGALFSREYGLVRAKGRARFFIRIQSGSYLQRHTFRRMASSDNSKVLYGSY